MDVFLQQPIFEGLAQWTVDEGTPQGAVISPLLANLYLDPFDHAVAAAGYEMVRYADDFVILCRTAAAAQQALALVQRWTAAAGLRRHPEKTHLVDMQQPGGVDFLGYHFGGRGSEPNRLSLPLSRVHVLFSVRAPLLRGSVLHFPWPPPSPRPRKSPMTGKSRETPLL